MSNGSTGLFTCKELVLFGMIRNVRGSGPEQASPMSSQLDQNSGRADQGEVPALKTRGAPAQYNDGKKERV